MGKLRLVRGDYALAGAYLERALEVGAPEMVRFELGQCYYLSGEREHGATKRLGQYVSICWMKRR